MIDDEVILSEFALGAPPWTTFDPFLFCVHHEDIYPPGGEKMEPTVSLRGRNIGSDFSGRDGWSMYHGDVVPGFPRHPHRGFETLSIARRGFMDHSDSLGAKARFGQGDVQWMTAGRGIVHSEMFPLLRRDGPNPGELFQIWLNLPSVQKMAEPHFSMLWSERIPRIEQEDSAGRKTVMVVVAGMLGDGPRPPAPPPDSWASQPDSDVLIMTVKMQPGAECSIPAASPGTGRSLYIFSGQGLRVGGREVSSPAGLRLRPEAELGLVNGDAETEMLLLQGRPIGEPVAHYGPFVMNTAQEIQQAIVDFRRTEFGGWPWGEDGPVHGREEGRFALHASGKLERP